MIRKYLCVLLFKEVYKYLSEFEKTQWLSRENIIKLQEDKIKKLLSFSDYKNVLSFEQIPILTKEDVTYFSSKRNKKVIFRTTGGTTSSPKTITMSKENYFRILSARERCCRWWGKDFSDRELIILGSSFLSYKQKMMQRIKDFLLNKYRLKVVDFTPKIIDEYISKILKIKPAFIYTYPSVIYEIATFIKKQKIKINLPFKAIITTGEYLYDFQRKVVEDVFECKVVNEYGCSEVGVIGFECPNGKMHLMAENVYLEFLGNKILVTDLNNYNQPLIRYEVGDMGEGVIQECECKRGLPVIKVFGKISKEKIGEIEKIGKYLSEFNIAKFKVEYGNDVHTILIEEKIHIPLPNVKQNIPLKRNLSGKLSYA